MNCYPTDRPDVVVFGHDEYIPMQYVDVPAYEGAVDVSPTVDGVTLETAGKYLANDITIRAIPRVDAPNDYGTTVTIGG